MNSDRGRGRTNSRWTLETRLGERTGITRELQRTLNDFRRASKQLFTSCRPAQSRLAKRWRLLSIKPLTEGRDAMQVLRMPTIQDYDCASAISTLGEDLAGDSTGHRPAFRVAVEGQSRNLHLIICDDVCKIAAEAFRNAWNHPSEA